MPKPDATISAPKSRPAKRNFEMHDATVPDFSERIRTDKEPGHYVPRDAELARDSMNAPTTRLAAPLTLPLAGVLEPVSTFTYVINTQLQTAQYHRDFLALQIRTLQGELEATDSVIAACEAALVPLRSLE